MPLASSRQTKTYTYRSTGGGTGQTDVNIEYTTDLSALSRLEDKIRLLSEDLESERELRQRIEREKADLSVQVISLQERLEEAEGGAESQFEINKKRDTELLKLRKLLEDVHLESEETATLLRKKHQEVVVDFQEQLDLVSKAKSKAEKEKAKFQQEVYELLSQVEQANKEKIISIKHSEKLEVTIHELNVRIEELNRTIVDITSHKTRLSQEVIELTKEVQDLKVNIENVTYLRSQVASQLEDARRRLEEDERRRSSLEASLHQIEVELESTRVQLEEEAEARLDLERQLVKANSDAATWKSKYDSEAAARHEEVEEIRKKYTIRLQEQEEHIETLVVKINNLEKQKSRLQSEVEVLIIDLEKANNSAREFSKRVEQLERINIELKTRLDETTVAFEQSQRDLRARTQDIQRLNHELEKTREAKDSLTRENKKLADDLHDAKNSLAEMNRRLHELEIELRRLENEREELSAAYREAEAGRKAEEQRAMRLSAEFGQFRHEAEKRIQEKDEEIETIRFVDSVRVVMPKAAKDTNEEDVFEGLVHGSKTIKGRSARGIGTQLMGEVYQNMFHESKKEEKQSITQISAKERREIMKERWSFSEKSCDELLKPIEDIRNGLIGLEFKTSASMAEQSKQTSIEIEQLNARVAEAETKLKTEVIRIKKKLQVQITDLELSLDVANKNNLQLQQTIKKQSLSLTELQAHYDETQRQLAVTMDQLAIASRKVQSLSVEIEEIRGNYENALRGKRSAEQMYEDAQSRINELTTINVNIASQRAKLEQELSSIAADYEEVTKELRISDERYQKVQVELKHTVEHLHEEQERIIKIETIKKSLEIEVKNLSVRLEEVEANAIVGGRRVISKLEARIKDMELELDEEKRRHAETVKILRKKERSIKEIQIQVEEDCKNLTMLQEALDKANQKISIYKRQLTETEGMSAQNVTRVRRFQRELEAAEDRADAAESNLSLIRAKHRTFVTTSTVPGSQVYLVKETHTSHQETSSY